MNAKLLTQQKTASPNQCRCFTLRTKQWPCIAKRKVITATAIDQTGLTIYVPVFS